jgi:hypothetical protein
MPRAVAPRERPIVVNVGTEAAAPAEPTPAVEKPARPDFWTYMLTAPKKEWEEELIVYLTREEPKTGINGTGGYLVKLVQPFDIEDIKRAYGGYRFSYIMRKKGTILYSGDFKVEAPPKFDLQRENPNGAGGPGPARADSNGDLLKEFVSVLRDELARSREANGNSSSADAAIDMVSKASERAMEIVKSQVPAGQDPSDQLGKLVGTLKSLGLFDRPAAAGGGILETITVLKELGVFSKPKTMLEQIAELNALKEFMGGGEGGTGKTTWLDLARDAVPRVLDTLSAAAASSQVQQRPRAVPPQPAARVAPPGPQPQAAPPQRATPAAASSSSGLRMVPVDESGEIQEPPQVNVAAEEPFSVVMRKKIAETVHFGEDAENDAADLVNFLQIAWPEGARYLETLSEEQITNFFAMDPILVIATQDPRWREVITHAKAYAMELLADAGPEPPTPPARKPN